MKVFERFLGFREGIIKEIFGSGFGPPFLSRRLPKLTCRIEGIKRCRRGTNDCKMTPGLIFKLDYATPRPKMRRKSILPPMFVMLVYGQLGIIFSQWAMAAFKSLRFFGDFAALVALGAIALLMFNLSWKALGEIGSRL